MEENVLTISTEKHSLTVYARSEAELDDFIERGIMPAKKFCERFMEDNPREDSGSSWNRPSASSPRASTFGRKSVAKGYGVKKRAFSTVKNSDRDAADVFSTTLEHRVAVKTRAVDKMKVEKKTMPIWDGGSPFAKKPVNIVDPIESDEESGTSEKSASARRLTFEQKQEDEVKKAESAHAPPPPKKPRVTFVDDEDSKETKQQKIARESSNFLKAMLEPSPPEPIDTDSDDVNMPITSLSATRLPPGRPGRALEILKMKSAMRRKTAPAEEEERSSIPPNPHARKKQGYGRAAHSYFPEVRHSEMQRDELRRLPFDATASRACSCTHDASFANSKTFSNATSITIYATCFACRSAPAPHPRSGLTTTASTQGVLTPRISAASGTLAIAAT